MSRNLETQENLPQGTPEMEPVRILDDRTGPVITVRTATGSISGRRHIFRDRCDTAENRS
jgi:hypothetical protein